MTTWPLFSVRLSHMHEATLFALLRITQLIVKCTAASLSVVPVVRAIPDASDPTTVHFSCALDLDGIKGFPFGYAGGPTNLSVMHVLQYILAAAAYSIGWESHVLISPPGRPAFPSILHSVCRAKLRGVSSACYYGIDVSLLDDRGHEMQRLCIGKQLGTELTGDRMLCTGKVSHFTKTGSHETVVRLATSRSISRPLLLASHLDAEAMLAKMVVARVEPVRGRIFLRVVAWSALHLELFLR